jgi:hypothetical protein
MRMMQLVRSMEEHPLEMLADDEHIEEYEKFMWAKLDTRRRRPPEILNPTQANWV